MKWRETEKEMPKGDGYVWVMEIDESVPTLRESSLVRDFDKGDQMGFPLWAYAIEPEDTQQYKDEMENARLNTIKWNMECREQYKAMKAKEEASLEDQYDKAYTAAQDMWDSIDKDISNRLKEAMEKDKELKEEDEDKSPWKLFSEEKPEFPCSALVYLEGEVVSYFFHEYLNIGATHWMYISDALKCIPKPLHYLKNPGITIRRGDGDVSSMPCKERMEIVKEKETPGIRTTNCVYGVNEPDMFWKTPDQEPKADSPIIIVTIHDNFVFDCVYTPKLFLVQRGSGRVHLDKELIKHWCYLFDAFPFLRPPEE